MKLMEKIEEYRRSHRDTLFMSSRDQFLTYGELAEYSGKLAKFIDAELGDNKTPLMIYGHKSPYMLVCFMACVKSGRPYCPVDITVPSSRVVDIAQAVDAPFIFATEHMDCSVQQRVIGLEEIRDIIAEAEEEIDAAKQVKGDDVFYIIFTSGSTGKPKGVQITYDNLNNFVQWSAEIAGTLGRKATYMNQAPFSFDLSVMDLYTALYTGGTIYTVDKKAQNNMAELIKTLREGDITVWVSTPSFADICMSNPEYNQELIPSLETFMFCGETLTVETASRLRQRFPGRNIVNLYGPTEATVAVTAMEIKDDMLKSAKALPVGAAHEGTEIFIRREDGVLSAENEERGEIVISGNTVSPGYFHDPDKTKEVFLPRSKYRTGDEGYLKDGVLHYVGRMDLQIKMHGYRIELGDIESNLVTLPEVQAAAVLPKYKDGKIRSLVGFVVPSEKPESGMEAAKRIKQEMKKLLPEYMIPKKIKFVDHLPVTANGKTDRKVLEGQL